eukprot:819609_1
MDLSHMSGQFIESTTTFHRTLITRKGFFLEPCYVRSSTRHFIDMVFQIIWSRQSHLTCIAFETSMHASCMYFQLKTQLKLQRALFAAIPVLAKCFWRSSCDGNVRK